MPICANAISSATAMNPATRNGLASGQYISPRPFWPRPLRPRAGLDRPGYPSYLAAPIILVASCPCNGRRNRVMPRLWRLMARTGSVHRFGDAEAGEFIGALVAGVAVVAFHPAPGDLVRFHRRGQPLPQVHVLDRLP